MSGFLVVLQCVDTMVLLKKVQRHFLQSLKNFLDLHGIEDISASQALLLFHIGQRTIKISEILDNFLYDGANPSYNLKKMSKAKYIMIKRNNKDRRTFFITASEKGIVLRQKMMLLFTHQEGALQCQGFDPKKWATWREDAAKLSLFWHSSYSYSIAQCRSIPQSEIIKKAF